MKAKVLSIDCHDARVLMEVKEPGLYGAVWTFWFPVRGTRFHLTCVPGTQVNLALVEGPQGSYFDVTQP